MPTEKHTCHARRCRTTVPPKLLMCGPHWRMVPTSLKRAVWAHYVPGQEIRKDPTPEFLWVMQAAIDAVDQAEQRRARQREQQILGEGFGG